MSAFNDDSKKLPLAEKRIVTAGYLLRTLKEPMYILVLESYESRLHASARSRLNFFFVFCFLYDIVRGGYPLNNHAQLPVNKAEQRDNIIGSQRVPPTPATSLRHLSPDSRRKTLKSAYCSNKETKRLIHIKYMIRLPASYYVNLITG